MIISTLQISLFDAILLATFVSASASPWQADFTSCKADFERNLTGNGTMCLDAKALLWPEDRTLTHFLGDYTTNFCDGSDIDGNHTKRLIAVTVSGCKAKCGNGPDLNDVNQAFQIFATWVLPVIALIAQLPYESLSERKRKNMWALAAWLGSPAATLAATLWNLHIIKCCAKASSRAPRDGPDYKDVYYVLSCLNQYEYPLNGHLDPNAEEVPDPNVEKPPEYMKYTVKRMRDRDKALFYGLCRPLRADLPMNDRTRAESLWMIHELAFQLRMSRRRAVWPLSLSIIWFYVAFIISVVVAFKDLGDNTTAHSLALGLFLSWLPSVLIVTIVDRNPVVGTRCKILIERWLHNCHRLRTQPVNEQRERWTSGGTDFTIGEFVGQGRYPGYRGVVAAITDMMKNERIHSGNRENGPMDTLDNDRHKIFSTKCVTKPWAWVRRWICGLVVQSIAVWMAFMVAFNTPAVGLGCRSLMYLIYFCLSFIPWLLAGIPQDTLRSLSRYLLQFTRTLNVLAVLLLFLIMIFQVLGVLNNCFCNATFGSKAYGRYVMFENAQYYKENFNVQVFWGSATAVGLLSSLVMLFWAVLRWLRCKELWKQGEDHEVELPAGAEAGFSRHWLR